MIRAIHPLCGVIDPKSVASAQIDPVSWYFAALVREIWPFRAESVYP